MEENWIVMTNKDVTDETLNVLCLKADCRDVGHPSEGGVSFLEVRASEAKLADVIMEGNGIVEYIEPDLTVYALEVEAESAESQAATWGLDKIGASSRANGGNGANIYVLDTGVRTSHNEFGGRASSALDYTSGSRVVCSGSSSCAADRQGHGTHCAGTTAGQTLGVASEASVFGVKVLGDSGSGQFSWSVGALDWIGTSGKRPAVASMSLGGRGVVSSMGQAITTAVSNGIVVVVAAGNDNDDACGYSPAYSAAAITVGSTDSRDRRSSFSNYGRCVDIWGPGSSVLSAYYTSNTATRTLSGTSMACPHVSGAAAIIQASSPGDAPATVRSKLLKQAKNDQISGLKSSDTNALLYVGGNRAASLVDASETSGATGGCSAIDYAIQQQYGAVGFAEKISDCGRSTLNWALQWQKDKMIACMQSTGISNSCARCYEGQGKYAYDNCKTACLASWCGKSCLNCSKKHEPTLNRCVGRDRPEIPAC